MANQVLLTPPPSHLVSPLRQGINKALVDLGNRKAAFVAVGHIVDGKEQFNLVFAWRNGKNWESEVYVAKHWGERLSGGFRVEWSLPND